MSFQNLMIVFVLLLQNLLSVSANIFTLPSTARPNDDTTETDREPFFPRSQNNPFSLSLFNPNGRPVIPKTSNRQHTFWPTPPPWLPRFPQWLPPAPVRVDKALLTGKLTKEMCGKEEYKHLRSCLWALYRQRSFTNYRQKYLCKQEARAMERNARFFTLPTTPTSTPRSYIYNPCSETEIAHEVEFLQAEDMNGNVVELFSDINMQLFQTFFVKKCATYFMPGMRCAPVKMVVETAIYVEDDDNDPFNDKVELRKVQIPIDCALQLVFT